MATWRARVSCESSGEDDDLPLARRWGLPQTALAARQGTAAVQDNFLDEDSAVESDGSAAV
jgi:hypothetical protein